MELVQSSVRHGWLRPVRKAGLAVGSRWPWPVRARLANGRRMYVDLRSGIGRAIFMKGEFDPAVFRPLREVLKPGGTFLDVGANVGYYSMLALELVGEAGQVHAFEIDPRPLRCLHKTVTSQKLRNVFVHEVAIGRQSGEARIVSGEESGHSSVELGGPGKLIRMTALDDWAAAEKIGKVQAMKLDIEGGELWALQGAEKLLRDHRPTLVCEVFEELEARSGYGRGALLIFLAELGYRIEPVEGAWSPTIVARFEDGPMVR